MIIQIESICSKSPPQSSNNSKSDKLCLSSYMQNMFYFADPNAKVLRNVVLQVKLDTLKGEAVQHGLEGPDILKLIIALQKLGKGIFKFVSYLFSLILH